jgi:hypothetical protein
VQTADTSLVAKTRAARLSTFRHWADFCASLGHDPSLSDVPDAETRLCYLLVFGHRIRRAGIKQTGGPVRANTVSKALLAVGTGIAQLGGQDPRKETPGADRNHPLLASFLKALADDDEPAKRAYPANTTILENLYSTNPGTLHLTAWLHLTNLAIVGFYWLLRPAEYLHSSETGRSQAFKLQDITLHTADREIAATDASLNDLDVTRLVRATFTFDDQKNGVRGEQISHLANSHPRLCPVKALARVCAHLRAHQAPNSAPIHTCYTPSGQVRITSGHLTSALRRAAMPLAQTTGIKPSLLSAVSLRAGGATALLCSGVDTDVIQLLGRWKSDAMLRYLRVAAHAHSTNLAQGMLTAGAYTFAPGAYTEASVRPIPMQAPAPFVTALAREATFLAALDAAAALDAQTEDDLPQAAQLNTLLLAACAAPTLTTTHHYPSM